MLDCVGRLFPSFVKRARHACLENIRPPLSLPDIAVLEQQLGIALPSTYKALLACAGGFTLMGGVVQFAIPFFHGFEPFERLTSAQQQIVKAKRGVWPPPSDGMLCFAEFWMEADGDQALFDVSGGLIDGEYPIMYYAHEEAPPSVRQLAPSFTDFMETFLDYPEFA